MAQNNISRLMRRLGSYAYPEGYPSGPGGQHVRGMQPEPFSSMAEKILFETALEAAPGAMPVVEMFPTDSVVLNTITVPAAGIAGNPTNGISFLFPADGIVVGIRATVALNADGSAVNQNAVLARVQVDGNTELFPSATGQGPGYLSFGMLSGNAASSSMGRYPVRAQFRQTTPWAVYFLNRLANPVTLDFAMDIVRTTNLRSGQL